MSGLVDFRTSVKEYQRRLVQEATDPDERSFLFSHELFAHAYAHRDLFRAMVGKHSGAVVQQFFQRVLVELVREDMRIMRSPRGASGSMPEAVVQFIAAGLWGLLSWWLNATARLSIEDVTAVFRMLGFLRRRLREVRTRLSSPSGTTFRSQHGSPERHAAERD